MQYWTIYHSEVDNVFCAAFSLCYSSSGNAECTMGFGQHQYTSKIMPVYP